MKKYIDEIFENKIVVLKDDKNQYQDKEPKEKSFACTNTVNPESNCQCCLKISKKFLKDMYK